MINKSLSQMNAERIQNRAQRDAAHFNLKLKLKKKKAGSYKPQAASFKRLKKDTIK